jgi:hypothetical protein
MNIHVEINENKIRIKLLKLYTIKKCEDIKKQI